MQQASEDCGVVLVFAGGVGLGAYQAGAFEALRHAARWPRWIAGSSVGAINAALIAGSAPERTVETLRQFWNGGDLWMPAAAFTGPFRHAQNWLAVLQTRLFGSPGHFMPRLWSGPFTPFKSLYDLAPMQRRLERLIDFERLNAGDIRLSIAATDIETGELVIFDTADGTRLRIEHLLASCGYLPEFAPVEIDGRLLGDGGLCANAPVEVLCGAREACAGRPVIVVDLFARDGARPDSLEDAIARKNDLLFGNQTLRCLKLICRYDQPGSVLYLSYRASDEEAGADKAFDLSRASVARRWAAGSRDMQLGLQRLATDPASDGVTVVRETGAVLSSRGLTVRH